jgi:hypothetical protein
LGAPTGTPLVLGQPAPVGTGQLDAVSCADAKRCWAVGVAGPNSSPSSPATVIIATKDRGVKWIAQGVHGSVIPELSGISCPTIHDCIAVGSTGASLPGSDVVYTTTDGGTDWSPATSMPGALDVSSVQCASVAACTAIVSSGSQFTAAQTTDFGQTWQTEGSLPAGFFGAGYLSCSVATGTCLVAGYVPTTAGHGQGAVALSTDGGQNWALATVPTGAGVLQSAVCLSATVCLAAGTTGTTVSDVVPAQGQLLYSADGGHTWTTTVASAPAPATTTTTTASTASQTAAKSTTTTTAKPATPAAFPVDDVYGVACPSAQVCALVGTKWSGQPAVATGAVAESRDGGTTFAAASAAYIPLSLSALSCPTAAACIAVGGDTVARLTLVRPKPVEKSPIRES